MELHVIKYCAEECERQGSGEVSVYDMCNAWDYVMKYEATGYENGKLTPNLIARIGTIVEPNKNAKGYRQIPIFVGNGLEYVEKAPWQNVPRMLDQLIEAYYDKRLDPTHPKSVTPEDEFYYQYENIHPFRDGNGRSGKILYNYLHGTLDNPILPPNFWDTYNF